jgi:hypothetical protein
MMSSRPQVLEINCAKRVRQPHRSLGIHFDPVFIADVKSRLNPRWPIDAHVHDMVRMP